MTVLVVLTVIVIVLLIAGLAVYLYWAGTLLDRIGAKLEAGAGLVHGIVDDAGLITPEAEAGFPPALRERLARVRARG